MTGQQRFGSCSESGILVVVDLVNELATVDRPLAEEEIRAVLSRVLAIDPPSVAQLSDRDPSHGA